MNLKLITLIGTITLGLSGITSAAQMPSVCNDFIAAGNESIELFTKIKQVKPEATGIDTLIAQAQDNLETFKTSVAEAPDDQLPAIENACKNSTADMKTMNKTLRESLSQR